jgi:hypothetical protein
MEERARRLWARVAKVPDGCWVWQGARTPKGYGNFGGGDKTGRWCLYVHRLSWEVHTGKIPDGLCVLHRCDNPPCVNPEHLFLGTKEENNHDCWVKGRYSRGEGRWKAVLKEKEIPAIRALLALGFSKPRIARIFAVTSGCIHAISIGKTWKHVK